MQPKPTEKEPGIALGVSLIAILGVLLVSTLLAGFKPGPMRTGPSTVLLGLYLMAWGAMFLASYFYSVPALRSVQLTSVASRAAASLRKLRPASCGTLGPGGSAGEHGCTIQSLRPLTA